MATTQVLIKIGILVGSFLVGLLFFYMTSPLSKEKKKLHIDQVVSQLINFVIFIWLGKVIDHFNLFIKDPLAVLAYPSNASAFYIATLLFLLWMGYQVNRKKLQITSFMKAFVPVLLAASFVYEFIQLTMYEKNTLLYLALLMILLVVYVFRTKEFSSQLLLLMIWAIGQIIVSFFVPFVTIFDFIISRYFFVGIIILCIALYSYNVRRKVV